MHGAQFTFVGTNGQASEFTLDARVAEWLFAHKFWANVNQDLGTSFDQYEQDTADFHTAEIIAMELNSIIEGLVAKNGTQTFVRGWQVTGAPIEVLLDASILRKDLGRMKAFLDEAVRRKVSVVCDL